VEGTDLEELEETYSQWYLLRNKNDGKRIGARHLVVRRDERVLAVVERVAIQQGNDAAAYRSEIRYDRRGGLDPRSATVTTYLNGRPFMGGRATCRDHSLRVAAAMTDETGQLQEPFRNARYRDSQGKTMVFLPGLAYFLTEQQKRADVPDEFTLVSFPSDLDILVQFRPGKLTVEPRENGSTQYVIRNPEDGALLAQWTISPEGNQMGGVLFETEFVPVSRAKALGKVKNSSAVHE
jgi:hypothetical protein